jgi:hypothetical protein
MSHLFWLEEEHLKRIGHMFPKPRGVKRADVPIRRAFQTGGYAAFFARVVS